MQTAKSALVLLADGAEEIEAVTIIDALRRGGIAVTAASITGTSRITGSHAIEIGADTVLAGSPDEAAASARAFDAVVLPGGMGGTLALKADARVRRILAETHDRGAIVAAVCAAPMVLDAAGVLRDRKFCCYPGIEVKLAGGGEYQAGVKVVQDGNVISGTGPGTALKFALEIVRALGGPAGQVAQAMLAD